MIPVRSSMDRVIELFVPLFPDADGQTTCATTLEVGEDTITIQVRDPNNATGTDTVTLTIRIFTSGFSITCP